MYSARRHLENWIFCFRCRCTLNCCDESSRFSVSDNVGTRLLGSTDIIVEETNELVIWTSVNSSGWISPRAPFPLPELKVSFSGTDNEAGSLGRWRTTAWVSPPGVSSRHHAPDRWKPRKPFLRGFESDKAYSSPKSARKTGGLRSKVGMIFTIRVAWSTTSPLRRASTCNLYCTNDWPTPRRCNGGDTYRVASVLVREGGRSLRTPVFPPVRSESIWRGMSK